MAAGIDVKLLNLAGFSGNWDLQLDSDGDIASEDSFDAAIVVSLFSDKRADASQVGPQELRRGWIGDESTPGFQIGSRLWLFNQERLTRSTLNRLAEEARESLQWMIDEGHAKSVDATAERGAAVGQVILEVQIGKPHPESVETLLFDLWSKTGVDFGGTAT